MRRSQSAHKFHVQTEQFDVRIGPKSSLPTESTGAFVSLRDTGPVQDYRNAIECIAIITPIVAQVYNNPSNADKGYIRLRDK